MADDFTVILPLYGKEQYTRSWLENNLDDYFDCIIADGSRDEKNSGIVGAFARQNIHYIRYPADASVERYVEKICDAVGRVRTKYVMICDNDDLLLHEGIKRCIDVLAARPELNCAGGPIYGACGRGGLANRFSFPFVSHDLAPLHGAKGIEAIRLIKNTPGYFWYSVFRTDCYRRIWEETRKIGVSDFFLVEVFNSDLAALAGYCHIDEGHYLRLLNPVSSAARETSEKEGRHTHKIFFDDRYREDVLKMSRRLAELVGCPVESILDLQKNYYVRTVGAKKKPGFLNRILRSATYRIPVFTADQVRFLAAMRARIA